MDASVIGVLGTALGVLLAGPVTYHFSKILVQKTHQNAIDIIQRQETYRAASKFRATVIYELSGFYPLGQHWDEKEFPRLYNSIPKIMSGAAEFRCFVGCKDDFDTAVNEYGEYCRKTKYEELIPAYEKFPNTYQIQPGEISPREKFDHLVKSLLSFAEEK
ncbi:MAG: hypothetical protein PHI97_28045 [Desulfobulbus sp.]|nr:hypothetical protein [Desulfobulbus sp.]